MSSGDQYLPYTRQARRPSKLGVKARRRLAWLAAAGLRFANRPPYQTALVTGVAAALVLTALTVPGHLVMPPPAPPAGWSTFDGARQLIAPAVDGVAGGPWSISLAEGVAAWGPWAPTLSMWGVNASWAPAIAACQSLLSGPSLFTFWNETAYPSATGPAVFESGGAGLWTFVYLNDSHAALVASVLSGKLQVNGVLPPNSPCALFGGPFRAPTSYLNAANASDPSTFAETSYRDITQGDTNSGPSTAFYILGNPVVPVSFVAPGYNQEWSTYYGTCGAPGVLGRVTYDGAPQDVPHHPGYQEQITMGNYCYNSLYGVTPGTKSFWNLGTTFYAAWPISLIADTSARPSVSPAPLTTAQFSMTVMLNSGLGPFSYSFVSGEPQCTPGGNSTLPNCVADPQSWYAVLLSPAGAILDTFPSISGARTWTVPDVAVSNNDQLVLVSTVPVFTLRDSGLEFQSGWNPYVCCGIDFGQSSVSGPGPVVLG